MYGIQITRGFALPFRAYTYPSKAFNYLNIAPSTIGGYVQGSSEPDFETLKILANYFDVSTDYLLNVKTGNVNNLLEDELLRVFRSMTTEQQSLFIEQGKVFVKANVTKEKVKSP